MIFCNAGKSRAVPWTELKRENPPGTWPPNGAMTAGPSATDSLWVGECCVESSYLTSQMGQSRSFADVRMISACNLRAAKERTFSHFAFGHRSGHAPGMRSYRRDDQALETLLACVKHGRRPPDTDMIVRRMFTRDNTSGGMSMKRVSLIAGLLLVGLLPLPATAADDHVVASPDKLKWSAAPPAFPKGPQLAGV